MSGMFPWDRSERWTRLVMDSLGRSWSLYIPPFIRGETHHQQSQSKWQGALYTNASLKLCPSRPYLASSTMPNHATNELPSTNSSSSKIKFERNARFRFSDALPILSSASPRSPTLSNDRLHERSLSSAHLSHHTLKHRRQIATCKF